MNFALTGAAGYIAPRHMKAIRDTGHRLVAACDPHDSVGVLDSYFPDTAFFTEYERFDRHLEKLRRAPDERRVHVVSICAPNHLHDAHIRQALRIGADALCEKPLVINPWNLDALEELERESSARIHTILQLRLHPVLRALRERLQGGNGTHRPSVTLRYITPRGPWYRYSWKGSAERSGGMLTNIGIHLFDLLLWLFGSVRSATMHLHEPDHAAGLLDLAHADVRWELSIRPQDLPADLRAENRDTLRLLRIDDEDVDFTAGMTDLHTEVYRATLAGDGFRIADARASIELVHALRTEPVASPASHWWNSHD